MRSAREYGRNAVRAAERVCDALQIAINDYRKLFIGKLPYSAFKIYLKARVESSVIEYINVFKKLTIKEANVIISSVEYDNLMNVAEYTADISIGKLYQTLWNEYNLAYIPDVRDIVEETLEFVDVKLKRVLIDGFYKITSEFLLKLLREQRPDVKVRWVSMDRKFRHDICRARANLGLISLEEIPKKARRTEEGYSYAHPHYLCSGIWLPVGGD